MSYRRRAAPIGRRVGTAALFVVGAIAVEVIASILFSVVMVVVFWAQFDGTAFEAIQAIGVVVYLSLQYVVASEVIQDSMSLANLDWLVAIAACYLVAGALTLFVGRCAQRRWIEGGDA